MLSGRTDVVVLGGGQSSEFLQHALNKQQLGERKTWLSILDVLFFNSPAQVCSLLDAYELF